MHEGSVEVEGNKLVFRIHGIDRFLAVKNKLVIPTESVASVSTAKARWRDWSELRVGGGYLGGHFKDGRYYSGKYGLEFYLMHDPARCVTLALSKGRYRKIVFEVKDKRKIASLIRNKIKNNKKESERNGNTVYRRS
jgi:hypothetical protein